jgi:hypothetical protein
MSNSCVSIKQVLLAYKKNFVEKEIWSLLLACYQVYYRSVENGLYHSLKSLDISSDNVYLQETGEVLIEFVNDEPDDRSNVIDYDKAHERVSSTSGESYELYIEFLGFVFRDSRMHWAAFSHI